MKIRVKIGGQTNNLPHQKPDHNLYDAAMPLASWLIAWEVQFSYSYPNAECIFNIVDADRFLSLIESEKPDVEFDVLE